MWDHCSSGSVKRQDQYGGMIDGVSRNKFNHCEHSCATDAKRRTGDQNEIFGTSMMGEKLRNRQARILKLH